MMKIGMVGVGDISGIYLKNLTETFKEIELVAVCDLVKEKALAAKEKYNITNKVIEMLNARHAASPKK